MFFAAPWLAAQDNNDTGPKKVSVFDVGVNPTRAEIVALNKAYRQGHVIRMVGKATTDLSRLLGLGLARYKSTSTQTKPVPRGQPASQEVAYSRENTVHVSAVHADANGALHHFLALTDNPSNAASWRPGFDKWLSTRRGISVGDDPSPPSQAWTLLYNFSLSQSGDTNGYGVNTEQYSVQVYRLNVVASDPNNAPTDKYMVIQQPQGQPSMYWNDCAFSCGFWNNLRTSTIKTTPQMKLIETQPPDKISVTNVGFTIGASVGPTGGDVSAGVSYSWSQDSVETQNTSNIATGTASWSETFQGPGAFGSLPDTSKDLFFSYSGAIFEVPAGTTSFDIDTSINFNYQIDNGFAYWYANDPAGVSLTISPPIFAVNLQSISIPPGGTGTVEVTAAIPGSKQGLPWAVTNFPDWLTVSQTSGGGSASLQLSVQPGTTLGSTVSLNFDTNPQYAAPSVETNPLKLQVTVGQPPSTGLMIAGGTQDVQGSTEGTVSNSSQLYLPASGQFTGTGSMTSSRTRHQATPLPNSQVLLTGGVGSPGGTGTNAALATAELYDPPTATFTALGGTCPGSAGCMTTARQNHTATLLANGKVLIVGGADQTLQTTNVKALASAEIYDPATKTFSPTGSLSTARMFHTATLLHTGNVLIAGGMPVSTQSSTNTGELYDVATGQFTPVSNPMSSARGFHTATLLKDGTVLMAGGLDTGLNSLSTADLYLPSNNSFVSTGSMANVRSQQAATLLNDGTVLVSAGATFSNGGFGFGVWTDAELYDPDSKSFTLLSGTSACPGSPGCLLNDRYMHQATLLPNGRVLLTGGDDDSTNSVSSTELYDPTSKTFVAGPAMNGVSSHTATLIQRATTTIAVTSSLPVSSEGQSVTFTATVSTQGGSTPTGVVTFKDGNTTLGTATLSNSQATFSTAALTAGNHQITVSYAGDNNFTPSVSGTLTQTVNRNTTTVVLVSSSNPAAPGAAVTFTATLNTAAGGTPTGTVTFLDGATNLGSSPVTAGKASNVSSSLAGGNHSIIASYSGDADFSAASSSALAQVVNLTPSSTTLSPSANPSPVRRTLTISATVASSLSAAATGSVTFLDGTTTLQKVDLVAGKATYSSDAFTLGAHSLTAVYDGNAVLASSTSPVLTQTIVGDPVQVAVESSANPSSSGQPVTFSVIVTSPQGTPTGSITILDGTTALGQAVLSDGKGFLSVPNLNTGSHAITGVYSANGDFAGATSPVLPQVVSRSSTTVAVTSSQNPLNLAQPVTFTAKITSSGSGPITGSVTFLDGTDPIGTSPVTAGSAVLTTAALTSGTHSVTADYVGDSNFAPSASPAIAQVVNNTSTVTTITSSVNPSNLGQEVNFTARVTAASGSAAPTGTITFRDGATTLGAIPLSNGQATFTSASLASGAHPITAAYSGDSTFSASTSSALAQTINNAPTTTVLSSAPNPSTVGQDVVLLAKVSPASGNGVPTGTVTFRDGAAVLGSIPVSNGQASFTASGLALGSHSITAVYSGDTSFAASTSSPLSQGVNSATAATTTTVQSSPNPSEIDQEITVVATVAAVGGALVSGSATLDAGSVSHGAVTLSGGKATWRIKVGTPAPTDLVVSYLGAAGFAASTGSVTQITNPIRQQ